IPSHANIKYSSFPLTPSTQTTYPPHHPPPPRQCCQSPMISAASALSGFDLPARRSKNRSQSQKCVLRVFLRASASPRQEASLNPHPIPSHANKNFSSFPLPPSPQTTYPPHPPPPPRQSHPPQPYHGTRGPTL